MTSWVSGLSEKTSALGSSVSRGDPPPRGIVEAPLLEHSVQCSAGGVRRKGQAMGRRRRRRDRDGGAFQLGRAVVAALIIIVLVLVILRLLDVY